MRGPCLVALTACLALAGCTDSPAPQATEEAPGAEASAPVTTHETIPFTMTVGVGTPGFRVDALASRGGPFSVPSNATQLTVDAAWECVSGPLCELAVVLFHLGEEVMVEETTGPARIELEDPAAGGWDVQVFPSLQASVVLAAEGELRVAVTSA